MFDLRMLCLDLLKLDGYFMVSLLIDAKKDLTEGATAELRLKFILPVYDTGMRWVRLRCISCTHICN